MAADRQRLIRIIHVARRELAMDDDTYRAILQRIGNASSSADLDASKLQLVLDHLKACGFKVRPNKKRVSRPLASSPSDKKIRAMWLFAHQLGIVRDPSERALAAYVKRLSGVDALQWTDDDQVLKLIESLKKWIMRYLPGQVNTLAPKVLALPMPDHVRDDLRERLMIAVERQTYDPVQSVWDHMQKLIQEYSKREAR